MGVGVFHRDRQERELDSELRFHFDALVAEKIRAGMSEQEAKRTARLEFGGLEQVKEECRDARGIRWLDDAVRDFRFAVRTLRKMPAFTLTVIGTLALGIGANVAIFSMVHTLILKILPVRNPNELVEIRTQYPGEPKFNGATWQTYEYFRDHNHIFSGLIATAQSPYTRDGFFYVQSVEAEPQRVNGLYVTGNFFSVLGVKPALGRLIEPEDSQIDSPQNVAVVSWAYWNDRFQLDPNILGTKLIVEGVPMTIIGVAPREFFGLQVGIRQDLWLPVAIEPILHSGPRYSTTSFAWLKLMGRLRPGVTTEQANAELALLHRPILEEVMKKRDDPTLRLITIGVSPAGAGLSRLRDQYARPLWVLIVLTGILLTIACSNVAGMLFARGAARQREMAVRVGLGASRWQLARQMLMESVLLSVLGGGLGLAVAHLGTAALVRILASGRDRVDLQVQPDLTILLFAAGVSVLSGVLFGLVPALRFSTNDGLGSLKEGSRSTESKARRVFGKSLIVAQVSLSLVLLSTAVLFANNLSKLANLNLGFRRDHILLVRIDPAHSGLSPDKLSRSYENLLARLAQIPGVRSATICGIAPLDGAAATPQARVEGYQDTPAERRYLWEVFASPKYFETLGIPLLAGRDFSFEDRSKSRAAIIGETMAHYYFGNRSPLGKHVKFDREEDPYEIVGVVGDAPYSEIRETRLRTIYVNSFQSTVQVSQFMLRTRIDPISLSSAVRGAIHDELKGVPIVRTTTLDAQVGASIVPERLLASLSGFAGALGVILAAIGLYGLLAYTVALRTNEIGVRMAVGARSIDIIRIACGNTFALVCLGLAVGLAISLLVRKFAASLLQGLSVDSLTPIVWSIIGMTVVALFACYFPARRATRINPTEALRWE